jgi:hypothetical protein
MASDRFDDIDHLDFETPRDLEREITASARRSVTPPPRAEDDVDLDDGPTRLPGHGLRRAVVILVALLLLVALFLSSGILGLFRPLAPDDDGDRTVDASGSAAVHASDA